MHPTKEAPSSRQPGRMTSVMRATIAASGPKVLRIGLVRAGKIVDERVIKDRRTVTIGASEKNDFVLVGGGVPASFKLFERVGDGYRLNLHDAVSGKIALATGPVDVRSLTSSPALDDAARGRLVIGGVTLLFQLVAPPPSHPKAQLPASVQGGMAEQIDWTMTSIAAFSFLFHYGAVGVLHSDWSDKVLPDEADVSGLVQTFTRLPTPPPVTEVPVSRDDATPVAAKPAADASTPQKHASSGASPSKPGPMSRETGARLLAQLDTFETEVVGVFRDSGPATRGVLASADVPTGALDDIAKGERGVTPATSIRLGPGGGAVKPGGGGLDELAGPGRATRGADESGIARAVKAPEPRVTDNFRVPPGRINGAERVLGGARGRVRACYQAVLPQNPEMEGGVAFTLSVGSTGAVSAVTASPSGGITGGVSSCIQGVLRSLSFDAPEGGAGATISGSYRFVNANKGK